MRVVCIDDRCVLEAKVIPLVKGNIYTVMDSDNLIGHVTKRGNKTQDGVYYKLVETGHWYHSSLFIPINENQQDETELIEERSSQHLTTDIPHRE